MENFHKATTVDKVKKGEYIRLKVNGPVWIRGEFDRSEQVYTIYKFDDANHSASITANRKIYSGFTF